MMFGKVNYTSEFLRKLHQYKLFRLDVYGNEFIETLRKYAKQYPNEFPGFEENPIIGSIIRSKNLDFSDWVRESMFERQHGGEAFGETFLRRLHKYKTGEYDDYNSAFVQNLVSYIHQYPWEFVNLSNDPLVEAEFNLATSHGKMPIYGHHEEKKDSAFSRLVSDKDSLLEPEPPKKQIPPFLEKREVEPETLPPVEIAEASISMNEDKSPLPLIIGGVVLVAVAVYLMNKETSNSNGD